MISIYAPNNHKDRAQLWTEISSVGDNTIVLGDFNMVEYTRDRSFGRYKTGSGKEFVEWNRMRDKLNIMGAIHETQFT